MEFVLGGGARRFVWSSAVAAGVAFVLIACGAVKQRGELMLAMQTDLELPKDVDTVRIEVTSFGKTLFAADYPVGPDGVKIPATLGVVGDPSSPSTPIDVRVIAKQAGTLRVLRNVTTTVPPDRTAILRMPLAWLCWNQVTTDANNAPQSSCPAGQTCVAGECTTNVVDSTLLKEFDPSQVFGGSSNPNDGACVDTIACFKGGVVQIVDSSDCSIPKPASPGVGTNVAMLRKPGVPGICDEAGTACYVPLDQDDDEGWKESGGKILLPRAVCDRLAEPSSSKVSILGVTLTTTCATKTASIPTCGPWSSVGNNNKGNGADGGGTSNQLTSFDGTWTGAIAGEACDGSGSLQTSLTISQDQGGNYLVGVSLGPVEMLDGQCGTVGQNGLPATLNQDGSLTFTQPLAAYCSCPTADDTVTLTLNGGVLTESNFFTGLVSCPNDASHDPADASTPLADSSTTPGDGTGTDSGVTQGTPTGASFCATCSDVSCTISAPLTRGGIGTGGNDGGTISEPDSSAPSDAGGKPLCGPQNCNGCCDITTETCQPGISDNTCGTGSIECADCTALAETCSGGQCVFSAVDSGATKCGPGNCAGCCQGNVCQPGAQTPACGSGGIQCQDCTALSAICSAGKCVGLDGG